jgi:ABC-type transporter MlaC component
MIIKLKKDSTLQITVETQVKEALNLRKGSVGGTKSLIDESNNYHFTITKREIKKIADANGIATLTRGKNV